MGFNKITYLPVDSMQVISCYDREWDLSCKGIAYGAEQNREGEGRSESLGEIVKGLES